MQSIAKVADFGTVDRVKVKVGGESYLVIQYGDDYYAIENKCPHLGMSMSRGKIVNDEIVCPWHGSRYAICNGENRDWVNSFAGVPMPAWTHRLIGLGRKPSPIRTLKLVRDGDSLLWPE